MMVYQEHVYYLRQAINVSRRSREDGNTPFGCLLVDREGTVLLEQTNVEITQHKCTGHAETQLVERASKLYDKEFLWNCTLYSTAEPCAMCTGAIYWGNIGRIVYGIEEKILLQLTGSDKQNPTFDMPCREILARGQKEIVVLGPFPAVEDEVIEVHKGYWNN